MIVVKKPPSIFGPIYLISFVSSSNNLFINQNNQISIQIYQICLSYSLMLSCIFLSNKVFLSSSLQILIYLGKDSHCNITSLLISQHYSNYLIARVASLTLLRLRKHFFHHLLHQNSCYIIEQSYIIILKNVCLLRSPSIMLNSGCRKQIVMPVKTSTSCWQGTNVI